MFIPANLTVTRGISAQAQLTLKCYGCGLQITTKCHEYFCSYCKSLLVYPTDKAGYSKASIQKPKRGV